MTASSCQPAKNTWVMPSTHATALPHAGAMKTPLAGTVPMGYHPVAIAGIACYSNQQPPAGTSLYSDSSLQTVEVAGSEYQGAGATLTQGPLRILARLAGPQQSYRAEIYRAAIGAAITSDGDTQYIDNMAITKCTQRRPTHECSNTGIRHKVCDHVQHKRVAAEWIASHRLETEARNAQAREQIRHNGEVDPLAKMATHLPVPDYDPQHPEDIAIWQAQPPVRRENGSSSGGVLPLSMVRTGYHGCRCAGTDACSGVNGSRARYEGMVRAHCGTIPPPNVPSVPAITVLLSTNTSYTACVAK